MLLYNSFFLFASTFFKIFKIMEDFMRVEERFLKYVSYWTTSDEENEQIPSSDRQFELAKVLEAELKELGLENEIIPSSHKKVSLHKLSFLSLTLKYSLK